MPRSPRYVNPAPNGHRTAPPDEMRQYALVALVDREKERRGWRKLVPRSYTGVLAIGFAAGAVIQWGLTALMGAV